jgi:hypothetical protein
MTTYNLAEFYRQMGIKNPSPDLREFVQPVVLVGDFSSLCPQHRVPTYIGGGTVTLSGGNHTILQVTARAKGGCVLNDFNFGNSTLKYGIGPHTAGLAVVPDRGPLSLQASTALVESGTTAVDPVPGEWPLTNALQILGPFYIPPGRTFVISAGTATSIGQFALTVFDLPALEVEPA